MANQQSAELEALTRYNSAFVRPPFINKNELTRIELRQLNAYGRTLAPLLVAHRDALEERTTTILADAAQRRIKEIAEVMDRRGVFADLTNDAFDLYHALRTSSHEPPKAVAAKMHQYLTDHPSITYKIYRAINDAAHAAYGDAAFAAIQEGMRTYRVLVAEIAGKFVHLVANKFSEEHTALTLMQAIRKANGADIPLADTLLVDIVYQNEPMVLEAIANRTNLITSVKVGKVMFEEIRDTLRKALFENPTGALGARDLAAALTLLVGKRLMSQGVDDAQLRAKMMLWARTEGAIIQNDALMLIGQAAGMDGKQWQSVRDRRVRPGHERNDMDGVIPINQRFSDGSMDGGSGSVSPFSCRCAVGPAMLINARAL